MAAIVEGTISLIRVVLRKDQIKLDISVPSDLPQLRCRPQQIQRVVMNLVTNARDAINARHRDPGGKRISIDAGTFERDEAAWVALRVSEKPGPDQPDHCERKLTRFAWACEPQCQWQRSPAVHSDRLHMQSRCASKGT